MSVSVTATSFDLEQILSVGRIFSPITMDNELLFNVEDYLEINCIENDKIQLTLLTEKQPCFIFHTQNTGFNIETLKGAVELVFEFLSYDIEKIDKLHDFNLLELLIIRFHNELI